MELPGEGTVKGWLNRFGCDSMVYFFQTLLTVTVQTFHQSSHSAEIESVNVYTHGCVKLVHFIRLQKFTHDEVGGIEHSPSKLIGFRRRV